MTTFLGAILRKNCPAWREKIFMKTGGVWRIQETNSINLLKAIVNPSDQIALLRIINTPARGIGKTTTDKVLAYAVENNIGFFEALKRSAQIEALSGAAQAKLAIFVNMLEQFGKDATGKVAHAMFDYSEGVAPVCALASATLL